MAEVDRRQRVVQEIVTTEQTYVSRLQMLISLYIEPLKQQQIVSEMDAQVLFNNWQIIAGLNRALLDDLEASLAEGKDNFGSLFCEFSPYFRMYSSYLNNYENAMEKRAALMTKNAQFARFLEQAQQDSRSLGFSIADLLIEPVQRIPRYKLLLEQLQKFTPEDHPDHEHIGRALASVSSAAHHNNEQIRRREMREQILQIMLQFDSSSEASLNLMDTPSRTFIREAVMQKLCRRGPKEFKFWLFNDKMLYGEQKASGKYCLNRDIELSSCRVTTVNNAKAPDRAFLIESPSKSFVVWSTTPEEKNVWLQDIETCIQALRDKYTEETGKIAPVWTPDSAVSKCQMCEAKFGLVLRRHHCRQCGDVVCGNCSRRTMLLEHIDPDKPQRVCDGCFSELSGVAPLEPKDYGIVIPPPGVGFMPPTQPPSYKPQPPPRDGMPSLEPALARAQSTPVIARGVPGGGFVLPPRPQQLSKVSSVGDINGEVVPSGAGSPSALSSSPALAPPAPLSKMTPGAQAYLEATSGGVGMATVTMPSGTPPRPPPPRPAGHSPSLSVGGLPTSFAPVAPVAEPPAASAAEPAAASPVGNALAPPPLLSQIAPGAEVYAAATGGEQPEVAPPAPELPQSPPPTPPQSQPPPTPPQSQPPPTPPQSQPPQIPQMAPPSLPQSQPPKPPVPTKAVQADAPQEEKPSAPPKPPKLVAVPEPVVVERTRPRSPNAASTTRPRPPGSRGGPAAAARAGGSSPAAKAPSAIAAAAAASSGSDLPTIPYEELKNMTRDTMPSGVEFTKREILLSDDEFQSLFGCGKAEFHSLPAWKQNNKKKPLGLF